MTNLSLIFLQDHVAVAKIGGKCNLPLQTIFYKTI